MKPMLGYRAPEVPAPVVLRADASALAAQVKRLRAALDRISTTSADMATRSEALAALGYLTED